MSDEQGRGFIIVPSWWYWCSGMCLIYVFPLFMSLFCLLGKCQRWCQPHGASSSQATGWFPAVLWPSSEASVHLPVDTTSDSQMQSSSVYSNSTILYFTPFIHSISYLHCDVHQQCQTPNWTFSTSKGKHCKHILHTIIASIVFRYTARDYQVLLTSILNIWCI